MLQNQCWKFSEIHTFKARKNQINFKWYHFNGGSLEINTTVPFRNKSPDGLNNFKPLSPGVLNNSKLFLVFRCPEKNVMSQFVFDQSSGRSSANLYSMFRSGI